MNTKSKFCSECGAPLEESNRFCPICGAKVIDLDASVLKKSPTKKAPSMPSYKNKQVSSKSTKEKYTVPKIIQRDGIWSSNSFSSAFQWAIVWVIGWSPNWLYYGFFPVLIAKSIFSAFIGGFASGIILYKILNRKNISFASTSVFILLWVLF